MNRLLSRPALALSRVSVRRGGGHVMNDETISHWKKVSLDKFFIAKVDIFLSEDQFCIFFSKLVRGIDLILFAL